MNRTVLAPAHLMLAVAVAIVWGSNFVVVKYALATMAPLTLATLRFTAVLLIWSFS